MHASRSLTASTSLLIRSLRLIASAMALCLLASPVLAQNAPALETVASPQIGPGNITVSPDGGMFMSLHSFHQPPMRVVRVDRQGQMTAFPNEELSRSGSTHPLALDSVLGLRSDSAGRVWMLDAGTNSGKTPKLLAWDSRQNRLARVIYLPSPITTANSGLNDLVIDERNKAIYIADPAGGADAALVVVDLETGAARRLLQGHESTRPENIDLVIDGQPTRRFRNGQVGPHRTGADSIALDAQGEWLYYGPLHGHTLYRVRTADLRDAALSADALAAKVERYSDKPMSDGISIDTANNIYLTDMANNAITLIGADRKPRILIQDERLQWPDALSYAPDGYYYVVTNQLHRTAALNGGTAAAQPPFGILRFRPLAPGVVGH